LSFTAFAMSWGRVMLSDWVLRIAVSHLPRQDSARFNPIQAERRPPR
jgi:hypothetical protein